MQYAHEQQTHRSCGWCNNKASTRHNAHTHSIDECPELAKTKCGFCKQLGHTTGYCPVRKEQNREQRRERKQAAQICDSTGARICGGKFSTHSATKAPSRSLISKNPFMLCDEVRKPTPVLDCFECEKCGFQHSCLEVVEGHEATCGSERDWQTQTLDQMFRKRSYLPCPKPSSSWADMAEEPDTEIEPPVWDDDVVFPTLERYISENLE